MIRVRKATKRVYVGGWREVPGFVVVGPNATPNVFVRERATAEAVRDLYTRDGDRAEIGSWILSETCRGLLPDRTRCECQRHVGRFAASRAA